jgi:hypothetical protein
MRTARNSHCLSMVGFALLIAACSDPIPPQGQGAASIHLNNGEQRCQAGVHWANAPYIATEGQLLNGASQPVQKLKDGEDGVVRCTVKSSGGGYTVGATLSSATTVLGNPEVSTDVEITTSLAENQADAKGTLYLTDYKTGTTFKSSDCTFSVKAGPGEEQLQITAGRVWGKVTCAQFGDPLDITGNSCQVDKGYFMLENCDQ